jgi:hypothetical protein
MDKNKHPVVTKGVAVGSALLVLGVMVGVFLWDISVLKANTDSGADSISGWLWAGQQPLGNMGWVSLDSSNPELSSPNSGDYGVYFQPAQNTDTNGVRSVYEEVRAQNSRKYVWIGGRTSRTDRLGWITFSPNNTAPDGDTNPAVRYVNNRVSDFNDPSENDTRNDTPGTTGGKLAGWARVCSVFASGCDGSLARSIFRGGFDGWIKMDGANYNPKRSWERIRGFAWGGSGENLDNSVIGWIHFGADGRSYTTNEGDLEVYRPGRDFAGDSLNERYYGFHFADARGDDAKYPFLDSFSSTKSQTDEDGSTLLWSEVDRANVAYFRTTNEWEGVKKTGTGQIEVRDRGAPPTSIPTGTKIPHDQLEQDVRPQVTGSTQTFTYSIQAVNRFGDKGNEKTVSFGGQSGGPVTGGGGGGGNDLTCTSFPQAVDRDTNSFVTGIVDYETSPPDSDDWSIRELGEGDTIKREENSTGDFDSDGETEARKRWEIEFTDAALGQRTPSVTVIVDGRSHDDTCDTITNYRSREIREIEP